MFLFGLRDRDLIGRVLKIVLAYVAFLLAAFLLPPIPFWLGATAGALLSAGLIVTEVARRHPAITFGRHIERAYAFPRTPTQRRIAYRYALLGTFMFFLPALLLISSRSGSLRALRDLGPAMFVLAVGYPGVVNLMLLLHPVSHADEASRLN